MRWFSIIGLIILTFFLFFQFNWNKTEKLDHIEIKKTLPVFLSTYSIKYVFPPSTALNMEEYFRRNNLAEVGLFDDAVTMGAYIVQCLGKPPQGHKWLFEYAMSCENSLVFRLSEKEVESGKTVVASYEKNRQVGEMFASYVAWWDMGMTSHFNNNETQHIKQDFARNEIKPTKDKQRILMQVMPYIPERMVKWEHLRNYYIRAIPTLCFAEASVVTAYSNPKYFISFLPSKDVVDAVTRQGRPLDSNVAYSKIRIDCYKDDALEQSDCKDLELSTTQSFIHVAYEFTLFNQEGQNTNLPKEQITIESRSVEANHTGICFD